MAKRKQAENEPIYTEPPALNVEDREDQLISMAVSLAEERIRNGTASNQVLLHYLKLGSTRERLEKEKLRRENELLTAKAKSLESAEQMQEMYRKALYAMSEYKGEARDEYDEP